MRRKNLFFALGFVYLVAGLFIMSSINGFSGAKWSDSGMDLFYGVIIIFLATMLHSSYKISGNKNILYVASGFFIIVFDRLLQIFLQEIHLKTNYALSILPWSWAFADLVMVVAFLIIVYGLWGASK